MKFAVTFLGAEVTDRLGNSERVVYAMGGVMGRFRSPPLQTALVLLILVLGSVKLPFQLLQVSDGDGVEYAIVLSSACRVCDYKVWVL